MMTFISLTPKQLQDEIDALEAKKKQIMNGNELLKLFNSETEKKDLENFRAKISEAAKCFAKIF